MRILFNNVGQGDSILIEWQEQNCFKIGIIDCHNYHGNNPTLEYIKSHPTYTIEFILLSHFHYDHYSGMPELFNYLVKNKIQVNKFLHTMIPMLGEIYDRILTSQKENLAINLFFKAYEEVEASKLINEVIHVTDNVKSIPLRNNEIELSFLSPTARIKEIITRQISRRKNKIVTTREQINRLSTIILLKNLKNECVLLTSDAPKNRFPKIKDHIDGELILGQAPHHGSKKNLHPKFWKDLKRMNNCPIVFSVGDEPKDKLPDKETVEFFDNSKYDIYSTNSCYGIAEYFNLPANRINRNSLLLNSFSKPKTTNNPTTAPSKLEGLKSFKIF